MKRLLRLTAVAGVFVLASGAAPVGAQEMIPRAQVSAGYQLLDFRGDNPETFAKGWYADVLGNFTHHVGAVFEIGGDYKTIQQTITVQGVASQFSADLSAHEYMGGIRVSARPNPRVTPFGQFLIGGVRGAANVSASVTGGQQTFFESSTGESTTDFAVQAGGGLNVFVTEQIGARVGGDYFRVFADNQGINVFRVIVGAVVGF